MPSSPSIAGEESSRTRRSYKPQPIIIRLDPNMVEHLSPSKRQIVESLLHILETELWYRPGYTYEEPLPPSQFVPKDETKLSAPSLVKLIPKSYDEEEVAALATVVVDGGKRQPRKLDRQQIQQMAQYGTFHVPSMCHPNHKHTWKLAQWLVKGKQNILKSFHSGTSRALHHIVIGIPDRLWNDTSMSIRKGVSKIFQGICGVFNSVIGWSETVPKYSTFEIDLEVTRKQNDYVLHQCLTKNKTREATSSTAPRIDTRIYDNDFQKSIESDVASAYRRANQELNQQVMVEERMNIKKRLQEDGDRLELKEGDHNEYNKRIQREMNRYRCRVISQSLSNDSNLELKAPGYGKLLANRDLFDLIISEVEQDLQELIRRQKGKFRGDILRKHPVLSLVDEWVDKKVEEKAKKYYEQKHWEYVEENVSREALNEGLELVDAVHKEYVLRFRKEEQENIRNQLSKATAPARIFCFYRRIWRPCNWIKIEDCVTEGSGITVTRYRPQKYAIDKVATDKFFWRYAIILNESRSRLCNGVYKILTTLWKGPIGVQSLLLKEPFISRYTMEPETGDIVPDVNHFTHTLRSRLCALHEHVHNIREEFEHQEDASLFGKPIARFFNICSAYIGILIPGSIVLIVGQPLLTMAFFCLGTALIVTAPLWALVSSLFGYMYSATLYDLHPAGGSHAPKIGRWFPLLQYVGGDIIVYGGLRIVLAIVAGIVVHPILAIVHFGWTVTRRGVRTIYDWIMLLVLSCCGRVPGKDSFMVWRVAGPGITAKYCYKILPDVVLLVLAAKLESEELDVFEEEATEEINKPLKRYKEFFEDFSDFGLSVSLNGRKTTVSYIASLRNSQLKDLQHKVCNRRKLYNDLCLVCNEEEGCSVSRTSRGLLKRVKLDTADLKMTLELGTKMTRSFLGRLEEKYNNLESVKKIWYRADVVPGDYGNLTKKLLIDVFTDEFLIPLEVTDETIVIPIQHKSLGGILEHLMEPGTAENKLTSNVYKNNKNADIMV